MKMKTTWKSVTQLQTEQEKPKLTDQEETNESIEVAKRPTVTSEELHGATAQLQKYVDRIIVVWTPQISPLVNIVVYHCSVHSTILTFMKLTFQIIAGSYLGIFFSLQKQCLMER